MLPIQAMVMDISIFFGCFNGARLFNSVSIGYILITNFCALIIIYS